MIRLALMVGMAAGLAWGQSSEIPVPNGSFESPPTDYADPRIDSWQKTPKPGWYDESIRGPWDFLTGAFLNTPLGDEDHIDNCDGQQAVFLFAVPEAGLFQDYDSTDWSSSTPSHEFDARFEVGKAYRLTIGVLGGGGGMKPGASMLAGLFYRDPTQTPISVAATNIVYTPAAFPTLTHFIDYQVALPTVKATDPWAEQHVGIQFVSTVDSSLEAGYWDLDHVRLEAFGQPVLLAPGFVDGRFGFTVQSAPGVICEVLGATDPSLPTANWTVMATLTDPTGIMAYRDDSAVLERRFYQVRQLE